MPRTLDSDRDQAYPAAKARQGEIILKDRWQRIVFIAGLAGALLLGLVLAFTR